MDFVLTVIESVVYHVEISTPAVTKSSAVEATELIT